MLFNTDYAYIQRQVAVGATVDVAVIVPSSLSRLLFYCIAQTRLEKVDFWTCFASINNNIAFVIRSILFLCQSHCLFSASRCAHIHIKCVEFGCAIWFAKTQSANWMESLTDYFAYFTSPSMFTQIFQGPNICAKAIDRSSNRFFFYESVCFGHSWSPRECSCSPMTM